MATVAERLAEVEGKIASSWALKARIEYEIEFKERVKSEILIYTTKLAIAALMLLSGTGYLFIKSAVLEIYESENKRIISDLKEKYDNNLADEKLRFEWKRHHDYGKNYIYLTDVYWNSDIGDKQKKRALIEKHFSNANTYFLYAMRTDPQQATTYWELGELHYSYSKKYEQSDWFDPEKALYFYQQASKLYTEIEISHGWRADAYKAIGTIYFDLAQTTVKDNEITNNLVISREYISKARNDYVKAVPESREYNKDRLIEVDNLLMKLSKLLRK